MVSMMNPAIQIRTARAEDSGLILRFIQELAEYEKLAHEVTATEAGVQRNLFGERATAHALLAFEGEQPAGFAVYFFAFSTFRAAPVLYLEDIFVKPELRGRGIGKALFQELLGIARERECARFEWSVLDWNESAMRFYDSIGARPLREWIKYRLEGEGLREASEAC